MKAQTRMLDRINHYGYNEYPKEEMVQIQGYEYSEGENWDTHYEKKTFYVPLSTLEDIIKDIIDKEKLKDNVPYRGPGGDW